MARFYADRVAFTSATTGTGNLVPGAAINDSFLDPSETAIQNGDTVYLLIQEGLDFEIVDATYVSAGPHFTRDTVIVSKIGGTVGTSKINLGGEQVVRIVHPSVAMHDPVTLSGSLDYLTISGQQITRGAIDLADDVTGTLPAANLPTATETAIGGVELATDAEIRSSTGANHAICGADLSSALGAVALTDAAPVAVDWSAGIYFTLTVTANRQIGNPSNEVPGQTRYIYVVGNNTTDRTLTFGNQFFGDIPTITDCDSGQPYLLIITCATTDRFIVTARKVW